MCCWLFLRSSVANLQKWFNLANGSERRVMQFACCLILSPFSVYYSNDQDKKSQRSAHFHLLLCCFYFFHTYLLAAFNCDNEKYCLVFNAKCMTCLSDKHDCLSVFLWPFPWSVWDVTIPLSSQIHSCTQTERYNCTHQLYVHTDYNYSHSHSITTVFLNFSGTNDL